MIDILSIDIIKNAQKRIGDFVKKTPLIHSAFFSELCKGTVYLKLENQQLTNSFKIRGAFNRMLQLSREEKKKGVITASSGNHALGVALAAKHIGISTKIVVPTKISKAKLDKLNKYDVMIIQEGNYDEVENIAKKLSFDEGLTYISPYNDIEIIAGQGTIGIEIFEELGHINSIIIPVGGGGMVSGIAIALKHLDPTIKIIGVQTKGASTMYESWKKGKVVSVKETNTLAEGLSGGLESGALTFKIIKKFVDEIKIVKERNIKKAITLLWEKEQQVVEGAGATSVAYIIENKKQFKDKIIVAVISGGNIEESLFQKIIKKDELLNR